MVTDVRGFSVTRFEGVRHVMREFLIVVILWFQVAC